MVDKKSFLSKKVLFIAVPILVIIIVYLALIFPWPNSSKVSGTMGAGDDGIQKAQKYRASQMTEADVVLKNPEFQQIIQSSAFQKLLKNGEFVKFASSGNLSNLASHNIIGLVGNQNFIALYNQPAFVALCKNETFNKVVGLTQFSAILFDKNINYALAKGQYSKVESNALFKNLAMALGNGYNQVELNAIYSLMKSEDYKNVVMSQQFIALANSQMFNAYLKSGNLNAFPSGMAMMSLNSLGLANLCNQQGFIFLASSQQFTHLAQSGNLGMLNSNISE